MANLAGIHSVGSSVVTYLQNTYPEPLRTDHSCEFLLLSSGEMTDTDNFGTTLSLFLHRVSINEHLRNAVRISPPNRTTSLALNLHYLMTVWSNSALTEQTILAWAMRQLYLNPVLDASSLSPEGGWDPEDRIQLVPEKMSNEEMMRIWDAIAPTYRLSFPYTARIVEIATEPSQDGLPVVATRFSLVDEVPAS